jgi:hypothetical protein
MITHMEKHIIDLIYDHLTAHQRYELALSILKDFDPVEKEVVEEISEEVKEEYGSRKKAYLEGKMEARPWREVIKDLKS